MSHAMFRSLILLSCLSTLFSAAEPSAVPLRELMPGEPSRADLVRARDRLVAWESVEPQKVPRVMRVCYWSPADRVPQPQYRERLTRVMQSVQAFYLREMAAWGFPGRSIQLESGSDGLLKLHMVKGTLKSEECSEADGSDGRAIRADCLKTLREQAGIDGDAETLVIFCNLADWNPQTREMSHHSPYYASGDFRSGTAWQVDSPLLDAAALSVKDQHLKDRQYGHISLGKYNSIFVGGVCHELGHALGLPHCQQSAAMTPVRGTALMGSGNRSYGDELRGEGRGSFLSLPHALKLAAHPQFSGSVKELGTALHSRFAQWRLEPVAEGLRVSARVTGSLPLCAVVAYADPAGGSDYDAQIAAAVPDAEGNFTLLLPPSGKKNLAATLRIGAVAVNGAATVGLRAFKPLEMNMRITADSAYEVTRTVQQIEWDENGAAARENKLTVEQMAKLSPATSALFTRLRAADSAEGKPAAENVPAEKLEVALSDLQPTRATTGWQGVHFDRTPEGGPLIGPEGLLAHGLYAHADSTYEYQLGGKWRTLSGRACLLQQGFGAIQATIRGDGRTLWESAVLKQGDSAAFEISVEGVRTLTLQIRGKDGKNGAWGAWAEPLLRRGGK